MSRVELYNNTFLESCLNLFRTNVPKYFHPTEENLFKNYLKNKAVNYYLFFDQFDRLVSAGGYEYETKLNIISLTWGMVDRRLHNHGHGAFMTDYRLKKINTQFPSINISLNTSQYTFRFYKKFGFQLIGIKQNGYGDGLDRYDMILYNE